MALSKTQAIALEAGKNRSSQEAIVKRIDDSIQKETIVHVIPGGKTMNVTLSEKSLPTAIEQWLRRVGSWRAATINLAKENTALRTSETLVLRFNAQSMKTEWEREGKSWLAKKIAEFLPRKYVVAVKVTKEGIFVVTDSDSKFGPSSDSWEPWIEFDPIHEARIQ